MERYATADDQEQGMFEQNERMEAHAHMALEERGALPQDETERLVALWEAPALLWQQRPARPPEPFGMIA
jgi:hypothetical protein